MTKNITTDGALYFLPTALVETMTEGEAVMRDMTKLLNEALAEFQHALDNNNPSNVYVRVPEWAARRLLTAVTHLETLTSITKEDSND